jgi:hypothetical protein
VKDREPAKLIKSTYIPLARRTRTLADVKLLDSILDRESAGEITKTTMQEQLKASLLREDLKGE